jgi:hypothetical protein
MSLPSDPSKKSRKEKASRPNASLDATPRPPLTARDLDDLPGIRKPKRRASLAPPAPPPVQASAPTVSHELFDVEKADADYERDEVLRKAAARASARPHPPRKSAKPGDLPPNGADARSTGDAAQRLSTPLSWAAAKDPTDARASSGDLADAVEDEISDEFLEPADDSGPLRLPALPSLEPLASAIPPESIVAAPPSTPPAKRWSAVGVVALAGVGLVAIGTFVGSGGKKQSEPAATGAEVPTETPYAPSEANPEMRVPLPPLELDIGVPLSSAAEPQKEEAPVAPPVAPSGILPGLPEKPPEVEHPPFDNAAATAALSAAAQASWACRKPDDPPGSAVVIVRYAPSGRVTSATIEPGPFAGTLTGGCVATIFRKALVPPFSGDYMTVKKTVTFK